jgi:DNA-binding CsgD family transcriptional regulator
MAILERLCRGEPNKTIGRALDLPESTVKVHVREIMRKLSVSNRTQVAVVVSKMGRASRDGADLHQISGDDWQADDAANGARSAGSPPIRQADAIAPRGPRSYSGKSNVSALTVSLRSLAQKISKTN